MNAIGWFPHLWIVILITSILGGLALLCLAIQIVRDRRTKDRYYQSEWAIFWAIGFGSFAVLMTVITILLHAPFDSKYQQFYELKGTVESVTNVLSEDGGELSRVPVAVLDTYDEPIIVQDLRLMTMEGKEVDLVCTIAWEPWAADWTGCSLRSIPINFK